MNEREKMPHQDPKECIKNFNEVPLGFSEEQAVREAKRCIECGACKKGCPVEIDIPKFIHHIKLKEFTKALEVIRHDNALPAICGRVCPQEDQCEKLCILKRRKKDPIAIGALERFAAEFSYDEKIDTTKKKNIKIAVIGSGPAGLTCAGDLAKMGYSVTIFESLHKAGGVLQYGIPEFRLPKKIVDKEIETVVNLGVEIKTNIIVGKTITIDELRNLGYKAFFIGTGAGLPYFLNISGENLNGIYSANEFLTRVNLMKAYEFPKYDTPVKVGKKVAVIGAGNVAMDSARVSKRLGSEEVHIVYRRTEEEMPARIEEIERAKKEGVIFDVLTLPTEFVSDDKKNVSRMKCLKMKLGEPDSSGRRRPIPIDGSEFIIKVDTVVIAIGQGPNPLLLKELPDLKLNKKGTIVVDEKCQTSIPDIFAGGDIATGAATVISAMGMGKIAARSIDNYIKNRS